MADLGQPTAQDTVPDVTELAPTRPRPQGSKVEKAVKHRIINCCIFKNNHPT
jgi:hypothetical protein